jgi:hypothetical protein
LNRCWPTAVPIGPANSPVWSDDTRDLAVEVRTPRLLVGLDQEPERAAADLVAGGGALAAAPVRKVVREPAIEGERLALQRVLELQLVSHLASLSHPAGRGLRGTLTGAA